MKLNVSNQSSFPLLYKKVRKFLTHEIWSQSLDQYPPTKSRLLRYLRVILLALRGFTEDRVLLRASALTYFTLMSIVPILAMGFGIAKGFGMDKYLEEQLLNSFQGQEAILSQLIDFSNSLLQRTGGGLIAGVGVVVLFYSVLKVFSHIESSFNDIWHISSGRSWSRKFSDYLSMMLVAPVLMIAASGVNVYISTQLTSLSEKINLVNVVSPYLMFLFKFSPFVIIWLLFSIIYVVMPNTKVNLKSGIIAGILAGTAFSLVQWFYIDLQVGVSRYNAIYGSFAALPLFLVWLQLSWLIVLFGAEISFAHQNQDQYEFEIETENISHHSTRVLSLLILNRIVKQFVNGKPALTAQGISKELKLPIRLVRSILQTLVDCNILAPMYTNHPKTPAYQPAQYINKFSISFVINAIDNQGTRLEPEVPQVKRILEYHKAFVKKAEKLDENILVRDL